MKKTMKRLAAAAMTGVLLFGLTACGGSEGNESSGNSGEEQLSVAFLCNGTLGDGSFFDSAAAGIEQIAELGVETKIVEAGYDKTRWQPALEDVTDEGYDIIIVGTFDMVEIVEMVAEQNPDQKYILFDATVDYTDGAFPNVFSIEYRYNEGSFLAGVFAAAVTTSTMENANADKNIGFIGGIESPTINDFLVGYIEGAQYEEPDIGVAVSYVGDFANSTKAKEMALAQNNSYNVDMFYAAAGQAGLGVLDCVKDCNSYAIGMASDQSAIYTESDPEKANRILTSMMVSVDVSLLDAVQRELDGTLPWGEGESQGIKEGTIKLADNEVYQSVPEEIRNKVDEAITAVQNGEVEISSAIGMEPEEVAAMIEEVAP